MNESWDKYIQPILDSWQWDHFSWVWDPFLARYPKFSAEQQAQIDSALVTCAFDMSSEDSSIKALGIAEILYTNQLASRRLSDLIRDGLRDRLSSLDAGAVVTFYIVNAYNIFRVKEAVPFILQLIGQLEERRVNGSLDERPAPHSHTFQDLLDACLNAIRSLSS